MENFGLSKPDIVTITSIPVLISALYDVIVIVAVILTPFYMLIGGIQWIISGGEEEKVKAARNKVFAAIIGLIVTVAAWSLFTLVAAWLGVDIEHLILPSPTG